MKKQNGFTLVELLIVIVIIGILASLIFANFAGVRQRARDSQRKSDLKQIQTALELYRADSRTYPCFATGCGWSIVSRLSEAIPPLSPNYISKIPDDPVYHDPDYRGYCYSVTNDKSKYTIFANLENTNDSDAKNPKAPPTASPIFGTNNGNISFTISGGDCSPNIYNYWVNNP